MIETIEKAIEERLIGNESFKGYTIEGYPEDIYTYSFTSKKGCLLIRYDGSTYSPPQTLGVVTQDETYEFSVIIGLRYLKKYNDAYPMLQKLKEALTGLSLNGKKLYPKSRRFIGKEKSDSYWGYVFAVKMPTQEIIEDDNVIPLWGTPISS